MNRLLLCEIRLSACLSLSFFFRGFDWRVHLLPLLGHTFLLLNYFPEVQTVIDAVDVGDVLILGQ